MAFLTSANAGVMYNCVDRDGNSFFTDTPQDGMKCNFKSDSSSDTERFIMKAKDFLKPKPGMENYDVVVEITHENNNIYNVIVRSNKVDPEEALFFLHMS